VAEPTLLAVVEVEQEQRIRCQAPGCNHGVYRTIHVIQADEGLKLYGSQCCAKLFGWTSKQRAASYTTTDRRLTAEERAQLESNTATLLEKLKVEHEQRHEASRQKLRALKAVFEQRAQASAIGSAEKHFSCMLTVRRAEGRIKDVADSLISPVPKLLHGATCFELPFGRAVAAMRVGQPAFAALIEQSSLASSQRLHVLATDFASSDDMRIMVDVVKKSKPIPRLKT
jgi:hypothetical protein